MEKEEPAIELKNVEVAYGNRTVLRNINLEIYKGEYVGLIGRNGSGKTTLMKTIVGLIQPVRGTVRIFGKEIGPDSYGKIGYVPQLRAIGREFPAKVKDVVAMGLFRKRMFRRLTPEDYADVQLALHKVKMEKYADRPIGHLSGGELQKVLVAHALVRKPEILLLDEPTSAFDFKTVRDFLNLIEELNKKYGLTILTIQHNLDILRPYCERLIMLRGTIVYDGDPNAPEVDSLIEKVFMY